MALRPNFFRAYLFLVFSWILWFGIKVVLVNFFFPDHRGSVWDDVGGRVGVAVQATHKLVGLFTQGVLALAHTVWSWGNVVLPFVQDISFVTKVYVVPHGWKYILAPVSRLLAPLPGYCLYVVSWLNDVFPFEYKLGAFLLSILVLNKKISTYWKVAILNVLFHVFTFRYTAAMLTNDGLKLLFFVILPVLIFFYSRRKPNVTCISANLLFLFAVSPLFWWADYRVRENVMYHCLIWSWVFCFYYFLKSEEIALHYFWKRRPLWLSKMGARMQARIVDPIFEKIKGIKFFEKISIFRFLVQKSSLIAMLRSTPSLAVAAVVLLLVLYYAYASLSRLLTLSVWPWYLSECARTLVYRRTEDYESQLSFAILFLGFELLVIPNQWVGWLASLLHLPLLFVFKLTPVLLLDVAEKGPASLARIFFSKKVATS